MDTKVIPNFCPKCQAPLPPDAPQGLCPKCLFAAVATPTEAGQPAGRPAPPPIGEIAAAFPQLEILEFIGQGGMGFVFKARQPKLDRLVALKILPQALAADPTFAERFNREAKLLARLSHPGIVTVHDFGVATGRADLPTRHQIEAVQQHRPTNQFYYLLMEYVDGVNLRQAMQAGRFTPEQALAIVPKICDALQFAHNEGILHRDIKPENILLDAKGRVKIADFGIAKLVGTVAQASQPAGSGGIPAASSEAGNTGLGSPVNPQAGKPALHADLTEAGKILGSPNYMAPEQLENVGEVDHRADIYSLGVVFYEMLTGELPRGRFAPPSQKSAADPRVDEVVLRALEKEKAKRYSSADEVKTRVETIAGTTNPPSSRTSETQKSDTPVKAMQCWFSTTQHMQSFVGGFYPKQGDCELTLFGDRFLLVTAFDRLEIPLSAIHTVERLRAPVYYNPFLEHCLHLRYDDGGWRKDLVIVPGRKVYYLTGWQEPEVIDWCIAIREAVGANTGRMPDGSISSPSILHPSPLGTLLVYGVALIIVLLSALLSRQPFFTVVFPGIIVFDVIVGAMLLWGLLNQPSLPVGERSDGSRKRGAAGARRRNEAAQRTAETGSKSGESLLTSAATNQEPRFSRTAIVGACWTAFFLAFLIFGVLAVTSVASFAVQPIGVIARNTRLVLYAGVLLTLLGLPAIFGTTILGWVAVSQIRRSAGKLHGLWLAVFDGLLFPLLALIGLSVLIATKTSELLVEWLTSPVLGPVANESSPFVIRFNNFLAYHPGVPLAIGACLGAVVSFFIIRRVWRAVNVAKADVSERHDLENQKNKAGSSGVRKLGMWIGVLMVGAAILFTPYILNMVIPLWRVNSLKPEDARVVVRGTVTDAATGNPLSGVEIGDYFFIGGSARRKTVQRTDTTGRFEFHTWNVRDHHIVNAIAIGYIIEARQYPVQPSDGKQEVLMNFILSRGDNNTSLTATAKAPSFGPEQERVLTADPLGANRFLDLDTSKVLSLPPEIAALLGSDYNLWQGRNIPTNSPAQAYLDWIKRHGVDVLVQTNTLVVFNATCAIGHGSADAFWGRNWTDWERLSAADFHNGADIIEMALAVDEGTADQTILSGIVSAMQWRTKLDSANKWTVSLLPAATQETIWLFKTRERVTGALRFEFAGKPSGTAEIRYKLVQSNQPNAKVPALLKPIPPEAARLFQELKYLSESLEFKNSNIASDPDVLKRFRQETDRRTKEITELLQGTATEPLVKEAQSLVMQMTANARTNQQLDPALFKQSQDISKQIEEMVMATVQPVNNSNQKLSFGPVVERVVGVNGATNSFIDFDTGKVGELPDIADNPDLNNVTGLKQMAQLMARAGWDGGGISDNPMNQVPPEALEALATARREVFMQTGFTNSNASYRGFVCFETATKRIGNEQ